MEDVIINNTRIIFSEDLEPQNMGSDFYNALTVFLHSANYKFSLGSGSSFIVKQIIDNEMITNGKSNLFKEIQKIKKTKVCGVRVTAGGDLHSTFTNVIVGENQIFPNFKNIVHCVIPGVRIDEFETRVENMLSSALNEIALLYRTQNKPLFFCSPIIGINNFGYPVDIILAMYSKLLLNFIVNHNVQGIIYLWLKKSHFELLKQLLLESNTKGYE